MNAIFRGKYCGVCHDRVAFEVGDSVYVRSLAVELASNSLWVGTSTGVMEIDLATRERRRTFTRQDGLANEYVFAIGIDSQGYKWFGTNAGGASRYRDGQWRTFFPMHGLADYWVYAFAQQKSGPFWIGTWAGASRVDLKTLSFTNFVKEPVNEWIYAIGVDSRDRVGLGTEGGISMYDGARWRHWTHQDGLGAPNADNLAPSPNTGLGTRSRHDLSVMVEGRESYNPSYVLALHVAPDDSVWAGTWGGGLAHFDGKQWFNYTTADGLAGNIGSRALNWNPSKMDGRIVVGTYGGGMALYDPAADKWRVLNIPQGLADAFVYDVLKTKDGDIWIATWSGANRVRRGQLEDRSQWDLYTVENTGGGLPNNWVYGLAEGKDGAIWLATEGGLARLKDGQWNHWQHKDGLGAPYELVKAQIPFAHDPAKVSQHHARQKAEMGLQGVDIAYNPNYIVALAVDRDGMVWCGTWGGGLSRFDGKTWKTYTVADGLPANHVFMLRTDADGHLWIGTSNGLARFDGKAFHVYTTADGLFSNTVFSMASAADGSLWVGSFGGVARIQHLP